MKRFRYTLLSCFMVSMVVGQEDIEQLKKDLYSTKNDQQSAELLFEISDYYLEIKPKSDSAAVYIELLKNNPLIGRDSLLIADVMCRRAHFHLMNSEFGRTETFAKKALAIFERFEEKEKASDARILLGNTFQRLFKNKEATDFYLKAEEYASEEEKVKIYVGLGTVNSQANDLEKAIYYNHKAYDLSIKLGYSKYLYNIHNGLAAVYTKNKDPDKALESFNKALKIAKEDINYLGQIVCYHNIGYHYLIHEDYVNSKTNFESGISLFDRTSNQFIKAITFMHYAEALLLSGNIQLADSNLDKAEALYIKMKNTGRMPKVLNIRAKIERKRGHLNQSIVLLNRAITLSEKNEITGINLINYHELSETHEELGNYKEALEALERVRVITDSITNRKKNQEIEAMKAKFDLAEYQQELKTKDRDLELLAQKKKIKNYEILLLVGITLGLLLFIYLQRKRNSDKRKKLETEKELIVLREKQLFSEVEFKNMEITDFALHISERNKLLVMLTEKVREITKEASDPIKVELQRLQLFVKNQIEANKEKVTLNSRIQETQESFSLKLIEKNVGLSSKEIQVATYLRLNLPSKQIATQMGIAEQSVNNYRRSIRKKLKLNKEDNLTDYLKHL